MLLSCLCVVYVGGDCLRIRRCACRAVSLSVSLYLPLSVCEGMCVLRRCVCRTMFADELRSSTAMFCNICRTTVTRCDSADEVAVMAAQGKCVAKAF
mmetsp:Transcript_30615/g.66267  ORF Transcript_30615/g.66267 Transcript_30615/m.66267 type:complete len:97 (-) Transcript_30615:457-747(-)